MAGIISFGGKGDFSKATHYLEDLKNVFKMGVLDKYGKMGVEALSAATPVDSGETAASWSYETDFTNESASITFYNSHVNKGVNIAIILQYGHGTRNGGYVVGRDYINPAIQPIFDKITEEVWNEVTKL